MGFKMKGYRGFHGNKKSTLKNVEIRNLIGEKNTDPSLEPESGPQDYSPSGRDYYDFKKIEQPYGRIEPYTDVSGVEVDGGWDIDKGQTGRRTNVDWSAETGGMVGINADKIGNDYSIDLTEYNPDNPTKTGGAKIQIQPNMYDHFSFDSQRYKKIPSKKEFNKMSDKAKFHNIMMHYMHGKQSETKSGKPIDISFGQQEYSGPKWNKTKGAYVPTWEYTMGDDEMDIYRSAKAFGLSNSEFRELTAMDTVDPGSGTKAGVQKSVVNWFDNLTNTYDKSTGDDGKDSLALGLSGDGGGVGGRGATPISIDPVGVDKIPTDTVDPVIKKPKIIKPIWNPTSRADLINQLKDAPQFSQKRSDIYDQLGWARDHTTTSMDDIKVKSTKTKDALKNLNKKKVSKPKQDLKPKPKPKAKTKTKTLVKLPKDRDLAGKFSKGSKKRKKKLFKGGEGDGTGGGGLDFSMGDIGAGLKDALDSVFGGI